MNATKRMGVAEMVELLGERGIPHLETPGDYTIEAPPNSVWRSTGTHEVVAAEWRMDPGWRRRLLASLVADTDMGTEACTNAACDWCRP